MEQTEHVKALFSERSFPWQAGQQIISVSFASMGLEDDLNPIFFPRPAEPAGGPR